jgi:hypothetical protein
MKNPRCFNNHNISHYFPSQPTRTLRINLSDCTCFDRRLGSLSGQLHVSCTLEAKWKKYEAGNPAPSRAEVKSELIYKSSALGSLTRANLLWFTLLYVTLAAPSKASVCGRSPSHILGPHPTGGMDVCCDCCVLSGRGLCDELITRPEESYRLWCVVMCDLDTSWMRRLWLTAGCRAKNKLDSTTL